MQNYLLLLLFFAQWHQLAACSLQLCNIAPCIILHLIGGVFFLEWEVGSLKNEARLMLFRLANPVHACFFVYIEGVVGSLKFVAVEISIVWVLLHFPFSRIAFRGVIVGRDDEEEEEQREREEQREGERERK